MPEVAEAAAAPCVLVIDDEAIILRSVARLLERRGYAVRTASSGEAALSILAAERFDAILCDLQLPGMAGDAIYEHVARCHPASADRFIVATGDLEPAGDFLRRSGCPHLEKPYDLADLLQVLQLLGVSAGPLSNS